MDEQLLRVLLPTRLLADVDRHLAAEGSTRSRADFVREAVEQRLLELTFGDDAAPERHAGAEIHRASAPLDSLSEEEEIDLSKDPLVSPRSLLETRLPAPASAAIVDPSTSSYPVEAGPLFLHGRDYPSFWALWWLTRRSAISPPELGQYLSEVTALAWTFAASLSDFDHVGPLRVTTMFPRSTRNPDSASQTFQAAAIGGLARRRDGSSVARGPLPLWGVAAIWEQDRSTRIAPTRAGVDLLTRLDGLSLELPHTEEQADVYLSHLSEYAEGDFALFLDVLRLIAHEPNRERLVADVGGNARADAKLADVYAQSYVARGREWGFVEPKLLGGRYRLTERGRALI
jgi:hypothetical protein